jgi:hypothetical protein
MKHHFMKLRFPLILVALAVAGFTSARYLRQNRTPYSGVAYSLQYVSTAVNASGAQVRQPQFKFVARRADGSRAEGFVVDSVAGFEPTITKKLFLTDRGIEVFVHGLSKSTSTTRMDPYKLTSLQSGPSDPSCISDITVSKQPEYLGDTQVLGFKVVKLRTSFKQEGSITTIEEWKAPELACETLYKDMRSTVHPITVEVKALSVKVGELDASFFQVPEGNEERSPSEIVNRAAQLEGTKLDKATQNALPHFDARYKDRKP